MNASISQEQPLWLPAPLFAGCVLLPFVRHPPGKPLSPG
jgi:hypothetical protein